MGIDEISFLKGHKNFLTVLFVYDYINQENKIIAVLPDRKKETVKKFSPVDSSEVQPRIKRVCSDMYDGH